MKIKFFLQGILETPIPGLYSPKNDYVFHYDGRMDLSHGNFDRVFIVCITLKSKIRKSELIQKLISNHNDENLILECFEFPKQPKFSQELPPLLLNAILVSNAELRDLILSNENYLFKLVINNGYFFVSEDFENKLLHMENDKITTYEFSDYLTKEEIRKFFQEIYSKNKSIEEVIKQGLLRIVENRNEQFILQIQDSEPADEIDQNILESYLNFEKGENLIYGKEEFFRQVNQLRKNK